MESIYVKLFGIPSVNINGEKIRFPFKQVEALFYYLFMNGEATRDELMELLWPEEVEEAARKNLRNALYNIKKYFSGYEILNNTGRNVVGINRNFKIDSDLYQLSFENNEVYDKCIGEFLQGFSVKNSEMFENWVSSKREFYKETQVKYLFKLVSRCASIKDFHKASALCKQIIDMDEYNEEAYRLLINIYYEQGNITKSMEVYGRLKKKLQDELGIMPDISTEKIANHILKTRTENNNSNKTQSDTLFYGRARELSEINSLYRSFISNKPFKNILISGEAGIGKSFLKDKFISSLKEQEVQMLSSQCYQAEEKYVFKPWNGIFASITNIVKDEGLEIPNIWTTIISHIFPAIRKDNSRVDVRLTERVDTFTLQVMEEAVVEVLQSVAVNRKLMIVFEDLQWMDELSLSLLMTLMLNTRIPNIFFILTCRAYENISIENTLLSFFRYNRLHKIALDRLTIDEISDFIALALPNINLDNTAKSKIYTETEGNTFFVSEYINSLKSGTALNLDSSRMKDLMKSRLLDISVEGKKLMNLCSVFFSDISLELIKNISGEDELSILDLLEELQHKSILKESGNNDEIHYKFTHQKLREFVYSELSLARRKILHIKAAQAYAAMLHNDSGDIEVYSKLIYHFELGGDNFLRLKYSIALASRFLDFNHELFPVIQKPETDNFGAESINNSNISGFFNDLEKLLYKVKNQESSKAELSVLEIEFLHLRGRYYIRDGNYDKGTNDILKLIKIAQDIENFEYVLKGYRQMIYYFIQINDTPSMAMYIEKAVVLAQGSKNEEELAVLLRLKGLNNILSGKPAEGEQLLEESIRIFKNMDKEDSKHEVSIAAAYNYMGDIRKNIGEYNEALTYYKKAIAICENKSVLTGSALFKTNAAVAAYKLYIYDEANRYVKEALDIYERCDYSWGRSIAEAYAALLCFREEKYQKAAEHLEKSSYFSDRMQNPMHMSMVKDIQEELSRASEENPRLKKVLENINVN